MKTRPTDKPLIREFIVEKAGPKTPGNARAKITTEKPDRMGDIVVAMGMDARDYLKNPTVLYVHDSRGLPIGKTVELLPVEGKHVEAEWTWAPTPDAQTIKVLWDGGFLNATSIGFIPDYSTAEELPMPEGAWWPPMKFHNWTLLEFSVCPVPANAGALRLAISEYDAGRKEHLDAILKSGAVLNAANKNNLKEARDLIEKVLASAEPADDEGKAADVDIASIPLENNIIKTTDASPAPLDDSITPDIAASIALAISVQESIDGIMDDAIRSALADALGIGST